MIYCKDQGVCHKKTAEKYALVMSQGRKGTIESGWLGRACLGSLPSPAEHIRRGGPFTHSLLTGSWRLYTAHLALPSSEPTVLTVRGGG